MEEKFDYSIYIFFIILGLGCFFAYRIYLMVYQYDGYITDHNYYLNDSNNNREKVEKYLKKYLSKKYNKKFTLKLDTDMEGGIIEHNFCEALFGCLGVGKVEEIYDYYFIAKDDKGFSFRIDYSNGYKYKRKEYESKIEEHYDTILSVDNILSQTYDLYNIIFIEESGEEFLRIYLYDKNINIDNIKQLTTNNRDNKNNNYIIYITNEEETYNKFNNKKIEYISELNYKHLRDENDEVIKNFDLFNSIKKDENYFIIVRYNYAGFYIQIGIKEKE